MSSILYREGHGTIEHGIECESTNCEPDEIDGLLAAGWSINPPGYEPAETPADDVAPADDHGDGDETNLNPVRLAAKEAGIDGWDTKRIGTLEKMLEV